MVDKNEIIRLKKQEKTQREISNILGCSEGYVSRIIKDFGLSNDIDKKFIGTTFGLLTPIKRVGSDGWGHAKYLCVCGCGNTIEIIGNSLDTGNTSSCGCNSRKIGKKHGLWAGYEEISSTYFHQIQRAALERDLDFNITIEDMWNKFIEQNRRCALSGMKLMFAPTGKTKKLQTASIDRIDSDQGYSTNNIQWVHKELNLMKRRNTDIDFINWCHAVSSFQKSKNKGLL